MNVNADGVKSAYESLAKNGLVDKKTDDNKVLVDAVELNTILMAFTFLFREKYPNANA
uniref:Uncharacterized protein n=2 Tax=Vibrio TaxID=662 RepID=A0A0H3ZRG0_9VIBR|nr:hypothetical protein [Vibrio cyclitrophicus]AKN38259.1 hypothetical protein [Vibrio splendidus]